LLHATETEISSGHVGLLGSCVTLPYLTLPYPVEGHQKLLGGGALKAKILEAKYEAKLEFLGGRVWGAKQKTFCRGSMDIFWNYTSVISVL